MPSSPELDAIRADSFTEYRRGAKTAMVYRDSDGRRVTTEIPYDAELDLAHPAVQKAASKVIAYRKEMEKAGKSETSYTRPDGRANENRRRAEARRKRLGTTAQPQTGKWRAISQGQYKRNMRPQTSPTDRLYVPAALKHWRKIHGLSYREAQERVGYSGSSSSWSHWEGGFVAPPYLTLLKIISATGLGHWQDDTRRMMDPELRLDVDRAAWAAQMRKRRSQAKARAAKIREAEKAQAPAP